MKDLRITKRGSPYMLVADVIKGEIRILTRHLDGFGGSAHLTPAQMRRLRDWLTEALKEME